MEHNFKANRLFRLHRQHHGTVLLTLFIDHLLYTTKQTKVFSLISGSDVYFSHTSS